MPQASPNCPIPKRLLAAMDCGFLNAHCRNPEELLRRYGRWCWRMGLPMVWFERRTRGSRLCRVHLDLFTTPARLSIPGQAALIAVSGRYVGAGDVSVSKDGGTWDRVPKDKAAEFAHTIFRTVRRAGNWEGAVLGASAPARPVHLVPRYSPVRRNAISTVA